MYKNEGRVFYLPERTKTQKTGENDMKIDIIRLIAYTITILIIVGIIKLIFFLLKMIKKILSTLISFPSKILSYKDNEWNDIDRIILHTKTRIQVPRSQYQPNPMYYDAFMRNPYNEINTQNIVINLMEHTGYQGPIPNIRYIQFQNELSKHLINAKYEPICIQITNNPQIQPTDILALIIHECMYAYQLYYRIEYGDGFNQENVADIMAVYLGFYKNLSIAHKFYTRQKDLDYAFKKIHK